MISRHSTLFFLSFLYMLFLLPLAAQLHAQTATQFPAQNTTASDRDKFEYVEGTGLEIHTTPHGAKVFIDGIERGVTPFTNHELPARTYLVELRRETYTERKFSAVVLSNSRLVVTMEMEIAFGLVDVSVNKEENSSNILPFNPQISARGIDLSAVSLSQDSTYSEASGTVSVRMPIGNQTIHARAFGWEDASVNVLVSGQEKNTVEIKMKPAIFKLSKAAQSRKRFNPLNAGSLGITEYRFEVTAPGTGVLKIVDSEGKIIYIKQMEQFDTSVQRVSWDGTDSQGEKLPAARYTVLIEASPLAEDNEEAEDSDVFTLTLKTEINYSSNIFPLSLESGIAGLALAPMPHTLNAGSFQANAGALFSYNEFLGIGFPFKLGLRVSPFDRFELTSILNINPYIEHEIGWGASGSLKYNFFDGSGSIPLAFSLGASYTWASTVEGVALGENSLSPGKGVAFYAPLSLELEKFSIVFCPGAFWYGPEGFVPQALLSAGLMYKYSWLNTGVSARYEYDFEESVNSRIIAGAEINLFPSPSNIIYSLQGGMWLRDSNLGYYAGLGIGIIF